MRPCMSVDSEGDQHQPCGRSSGAHHTYRKLSDTICLAAVFEIQD